MMFLATTALAIAACPSPPARRFTCVVDGDTVWIEGERIRLLDIDAPEMEGKCPAERVMAIRSRDRLIELLRERPFAIQRQGTDRYGRTLARLGSVGDQLMREGLARRWGDRRGWCE
ncbi:thermonuclease family protein [Rhizorhabdus sp.]|uniref:thermonuclease family protein n=1 Tax=Rhizorhabdus sp. TaxID=1968843 RepID=UPI0019BDB1E2|nr:thermonuclease family protein [Rhizorhabdus sp.]MBD3762454.1 thermonuclease family protein [Rhizorhabdus sp.]